MAGRACDGSAAAWPLWLTGNPPGSTETTMGTILYTTDATSPLLHSLDVRYLTVG